ncbi:MAG: hypothetical protein ACJ76T_02510 [Solirubrobacteraceae bacterium]
MEERGKVAAVADPETPRRGRHPQRGGRVTARHDARLSDQRVRQQVRIAIRLQALDRMVVVLGGGLWIARVEGDAEIQAGVALSPQIAGGGLDRQRLVEQLSRAIWFARHQEGQAERRDREAFTGTATGAPVQGPGRFEVGARGLHRHVEGVRQTVEHGCETLELVFAELGGQFPRLAVESE